MNSKKIVKVMVDGHTYLVEVGDMSIDPVIALVDGVQYEVYLQGDEDEAATIVMPNVEQQPVRVKKHQTVPTLSINSIAAPLPGEIIEIKVKPGDQVGVGQTICVIEAMKMKNIIRSSRDGRIASVEVSTGQTVTFGVVLVTFK